MIMENYQLITLKNAYLGERNIFEFIEIMMKEKKRSEGGLMIEEKMVRGYVVAKMIGVDRATIHNWAKKRLIPHYKLAGIDFFKLSEIKAWMESQKKGPSLENI